MSPYLLSEDSVFGKIPTHFGRHTSLISHPNRIFFFYVIETSVFF